MAKGRLVMAEQIFCGVTASVGFCRGTARRVDSEADFSKVEYGDVLVVRKSSPAWLIPLMRASGLICEVGGKGSHLAILSRELSLPCITAIPGIYSAIQDGDSVSLDCSTGQVTRYVR